MQIVGSVRRKIVACMNGAGPIVFVQSVGEPVFK
jgi:hypothetical protein